MRYSLCLRDNEDLRYKKGKIKRQTDKIYGIKKNSMINFNKSVLNWKQLNTEFDDKNKSQSTQHKNCSAKKINFFNSFDHG